MYFEPESRIWWWLTFWLILCRVFLVLADGDGAGLRASTQNIGANTNVADVYVRCRRVNQWVFSRRGSVAAMANCLVDVIRYRWMSHGCECWWRDVMWMQVSTIYCLTLSWTCPASMNQSTAASPHHASKLSRDVCLWSACSVCSQPGHGISSIHLEQRINIVTLMTIKNNNLR